MAPKAPTGGGNSSGKATPLPKKKTQKKRLNAGIHWCFTWFQFDEQKRALFMQDVLKNCEKYIIGDEIAPTTGRPHLQGYIEFHEKRRADEHFNYIDSTIRWFNCKGDERDNFIYCHKEGHYVANFEIIQSIKLSALPKKLLKVSELWEWELDCLELIKNQNDRQLLWICDFEGGNGKSVFSYFLSKYIENCVLISEGKKDDLAFILHQKKLDLCILDLSRTIEGFVSYSLLEQIKNGRIQSGKYESCIRDYPIYPRLVVMANFLPEMEKLSLDRWNIKLLKNKKLSDYTPNNIPKTHNINSLLRNDLDQ